MHRGTQAEHRMAQGSYASLCENRGTDSVASCATFAFAPFAGAPLQDAAMRKMAKELRIQDPGRHIFLCCDQTKAKCCSKEAGLESWDYLKGRIKVDAARHGA